MQLADKVMKIYNLKKAVYSVVSSCQDNKFLQTKNICRVVHVITRHTTCLLSDFNIRRTRGRWRFNICKGDNNKCFKGDVRKVSAQVCVDKNNEKKRKVAALRNVLSTI